MAADARRLGFQRAIVRVLKRGGWSLGVVVESVSEYHDSDETRIL